MEGAEHSISAHLLRLSIKGGEYTYAKANDIVMIESSDHFTVVHVAQQPGKVKTSLRNSCLKKVLSDLPKNSFLRVNRFCAINLERISGGSYHQQCFEFDHCIKVKPRHPLAHAVFQAIGK
jgi:DNA-binding LytR/AlgR family response regulator